MKKSKVLRFLHKKNINGRNRYYYLCRCYCGNEWKVHLNKNKPNIKNRSCGCFKVKKAIINILKNKKHGMSKTSVYTRWRSMIDRCHRAGNPKFHIYGMRGITVCKQWLKFENFYADMGTPKKGESLDRIDVNKGYSKNNCRWATQSVQQNNRTNNFIIEIDGIGKTASEWSEITGVSAKLIKQRIVRDKKTYYEDIFS